MTKNKLFKNIRFGKIDATDWIALIIIIGGFSLMAYHIDTVVGGVVIMVVTFYFGNKFRK